MLPLILTLALADVSRPSMRPEPVPELATLTEEQALRLAGQRRLFLVRLDSEGEPVGGAVWYDAQGEGEVYRAVRVRGGDGREPDVLLIRGTVAVIRYKAILAVDGSALPGMVELRVAGWRE